MGVVDQLRSDTNLMERSNSPPTIVAVLVLLLEILPTGAGCEVELGSGTDEVGGRVELVT